MTPTQQKRSLSVLIPTHERMDTLPRVLQALSKQALAPEEYEIVVLDDGSKPGLAQYITRFAQQSPLSLRYFYQDQAGPAAARNRALARAQCDLVLFLDDDLIPDADCLAMHLRFHSCHPDLEIVLMGAVQMAPELCVRQQIRQNETEISGLDRQSGQLAWQHFRTGNASCKREFICQAGGFDEALIAAEDTELAARLAARGMKLFYAESIRVVHFHPMRLDGFLTKARQYGEALAIWYQKAPELRAEICRRYGIRAQELSIFKHAQYLIRAFLINKYDIGILIWLADRVRRLSWAGSDLILDQVHRYFLQLGFRNRRTKLLGLNATAQTCSNRNG